MMSNFVLIPCHKLQTPAQNFDIGLLEFKSKCQTANFQYAGYLHVTKA